MIPTLSSAADITPDWITLVLDQNDLSNWRKVTNLSLESVHGEYGKSRMLHRVLVQSNSGDLGLRSHRFFLKFGKSVKEVFFYTQIASKMDPSFLVKCFFAGYKNSEDLACLLLEDLSSTHFQTEWPLPPTKSLCLQIVERLAMIQAFWWEHPSLENEFRASLPFGRAWVDRRKLAIARLPEFIDFLGDRLSKSRQNIFRSMKEAKNVDWENIPFAPNQTLLHGDLHPWNIFFPLNSEEKLRFFDWNMWDIGPPTDDLAYLMAVHWLPERRARFEKCLLESYHATLTAQGIALYPWETFIADYKRSIHRSLLIPVWQWIRGISPGIWWPHLECIFLAHKQWNSIEANL